MKTAIIIGATGLVGSHLTGQLLQDDRFSEIKVFARKSPGLVNERLSEYVIDFEKPGEWSHLVRGDVLFSTLGTTLKTAGSKEQQFKVDYTYQYNFAEAAALNKVVACVLVSSAGADPASRIFYSRMKGELEEAIKKLPFKQFTILQPGILDGERKENRPMERFSIGVARGLKYLPALKKYRPVHAGIVARAMINAALSEQAGTRIFTLEQVFDLAGE
jgi:uncharacterized protein YbjT (DUF2867 family)